MPKLTGEMQKQVEKAAAESGFTPMDAGIYRFRLVEVVAGESSNNNPMWTWTFECVEEPYVGRKQWVHTTLTEKAMWKMAEVFAAFGVSTDTDTDLLIGKIVRLDVVQRIIGAGARQGQMGNNADRVLPESDEPIDAKSAANGNGKASTKDARAAEAAKIEF